MTFDIIYIILSLAAVFVPLFSTIIYPEQKRNRKLAHIRPYTWEYYLYRILYSFTKIGWLFFVVAIAFCIVTIIKTMDEKYETQKHHKEIVSAYAKHNRDLTNFSDSITRMLLQYGYKVDSSKGEIVRAFDSLAGAKGRPLLVAPSEEISIVIDSLSVDYTFNLYNVGSLEATNIVYSQELIIEYNGELICAWDRRIFSGGLSNNIFIKDDISFVNTGIRYETLPAYLHIYATYEDELKRKFELDEYLSYHPTQKRWFSSTRTRNEWREKFERCKEVPGVFMKK